MRLAHLSLHHFRTFAGLELDLPPGLVLLHGQNGVGKSNLLEACYLLAVLRSYRASTEREMLNFDASAPGDIPFLRVAGTACGSHGVETRVQVDILWQEGLPVGPGAGRPGKRIRVNGVPKRASEALGAFSAVLFTADDIAIVLGPPSERRRFLDMLLCQLDRDYLRALQRYQQVMTQRNALLRAIRDGESQAAELAFWDEQLADHGALILAKRLATVAQVQTLASRFYAEVAGPEEPLQVAYDPNLADLPDSQAGIRVALTREIARRRAQETASGQSLVGPHRDDVTLLVRGSPVARYGSRGQARSVALALRLAEARLIAQARGEEPVLLLDDILSELDAPRRRQVMAAAARAEQALLTAADLLDFRELGLAAAARYRVTPGKVERTEAPD